MSAHVRCIATAAILSSLPLSATAQAFVLSTEEAGLSAASNSNGVAVADYDLDGDLDVYFVNSMQHNPGDPDTWNHLYRNNGDGTFSDVTSAAGVVAASIQGYEVRSMGNRFGAAWGDYDNDGDPDLFLTNVGPEILYRNDGNGRFTDVAESAGVAGPERDISENSSVVWWDYDDDGDLDLYVSTWNGIGPNRMYENNGDGSFDDVTGASGLGRVGATWTSVPIDVNLDGWMDVYTVNDFGRNLIMVNNGDKTFTDETDARGLGNHGHGMGVTVEDYDNDGDFDIYLTNIHHLDTEWNPLYENDGHGRFTDVSHERGVEHADWAWGTSFFDCDHDGDLDLYVANGYVTVPAYHNRMFVSRLTESGTASFENTAAVAGVDGLSEARSLAVFDYDDDGDMDLLVANVRPGRETQEANRPYLYKNVTASANWLKVKLQGTASNRDGFGATLEATTSGGTFHRHYDGVSFLGQSIAPVHFGLADAAKVDELRVNWPSGHSESFFDVEVNQTLAIVEGTGLATRAEEDEVPARSSKPQIEAAFPNPTSGEVTVTLGSPGDAPVVLEVRNVLGQTVASAEVHTSHRSASVKLDLSSLPPGLYFYTLDRRLVLPLVKTR